MACFTQRHCGVPRQVKNRVSSRLASVTEKSSVGMFVKRQRGGLRSADGSMETNDEEKAQILANHFQSIYTRESYLPEVGLPSHTENATIESAQFP